MHDSNLIESCFEGFNTPNLKESQPVIFIHDNNLKESELVGFNIPNLRESHPVILMHDSNLKESELIGFNIPNLRESHPVIVMQLNNLKVSLEFFKNPCFKESQDVIFEIIGEFGVGEDSVFVQEYTIPIQIKKSIFFFTYKI